ncbi:MAG: DUF6094 domain-containing protein [Chloroflexota bacterium]
MGYLKIEAHHHDAILSLVQPAHAGYKMLDPFAGEGDFLEIASKHWQVTPYANELDQTRAEQCIARFGPKQAVRGDAMRLRASNTAFSIAWINPPYDHDRAAKGNKRVEFTMLRHSWKWVQVEGLVMWCVYQHHLTEDALAFFANYAQDADIWALPGKHLGEYNQIIVVARVERGQSAHASQTYNKLLVQRDNPQLLTVQADPIYKLPAPNNSKRFYFAPNDITITTGQTLVESYGAFTNAGFQNLLAVPQVAEQSEPLVMPRPGHTALILSAGVANGAVIKTIEHGEVALRSKIETREEVARVETQTDSRDPERKIKKTTMRLRPATQITLLASDGNLVEMEGDEAILDFIKTNRQALAHYMSAKFDPLYKFDYAGIHDYLNAIRLKGKYPLYTPQKHVIAAISAGFRSIKGQLLIGQMGVGKTAMGGSAAIAIARQLVQEMQAEIADNQVVLVVSPPHLIDKWKREMISINPNMMVEHLKRHEDIKAFMEKADKIGAGIPKIGLIKRDMTKLGSGYEPAVIWRTKGIALWKQGAETPDGYQASERIQRQETPHCPQCGQVVKYEHKGQVLVATKAWLKKGQRNCAICHAPLWQEKRDKASQVKEGYKFPSKNPRYRLDTYLKKVYPDRVYLLIWDEIHECANGSTGNGEAFGRLANISQKILGLTGTPFNGRASSMFNIEYHLNPQTRQHYPWGGAERLSPKVRGSQVWQSVRGGFINNQRGRSESRWVSDMGVREQVLEERPSYDRDTGAYTGTSTYERPYQEAPGCSPMLIGWLLNHSIFFSLKDLGKNLPEYTEIAHPVSMDADIATEYKATQDKLKDYLIAQRRLGDTSFRGAYLQWSMGWINAPFRPMKVIHNIRNPLSNKKVAHVVTQIKSYDEDQTRLFAKEKALIELVQSRLQAGRPVVVYARQTASKDIQPRLEAIIRHHVPEANPYVLRNTVSAERREKVIEQQVLSGVNVLICNPELVKTGLDLLAFPSLIFYEITFNLSTMLQAASRSYRLNQEQDECEVIYLFYEGTMEHRAVQLMSRKQRAAKILTGDTGLTGLDSLTEGEGGFEAALLNAITETDALVDPRDLFTQDVIDDAITKDDNAFWHVEVDDTSKTTEFIAEPVIFEEPDLPLISPTPVMPVGITAQHSTTAQKQLAELVVSDCQLDEILSTLESEVEQDESDDLVTFATRELGAVVREEAKKITADPVITPPLKLSISPEHMKQMYFVEQYLEQFSHVSIDPDRLVSLLFLIRDGVWDDRTETKKVAGIEDPYFLKSPAMQKRLHSTVRSYLRKHHLVLYEDAGEGAKRVIELSLMALKLIPIELDIFASLRVNKKEATLVGHPSTSNIMRAEQPVGEKEIRKRHPRKSSQISRKSSKRRGKTLDLMATPDDTSIDASNSDVVELKQLAFF